MTIIRTWTCTVNGHPQHLNVHYKWPSSEPQRALSMATPSTCVANCSTRRLARGPLIALSHLVPVSACGRLASNAEGERFKPIVVRLCWYPQCLQAHHGRPEKHTNLFFSPRTVPLPLAVPAKTGTRREHDSLDSNRNINDVSFVFEWKWYMMADWCDTLKMGGGGGGGGEGGERG